ncbi:MAG: SBBP repeat-containing protein [Candidatus Odinarchaeota archaeon]
MKNILKTCKNKKFLIALISILIFLIFFTFSPKNLNVFKDKTYFKENNPFISVNMEWVQEVTSYSESTGTDIAIDNDGNVYIVAHAFNDSKMVNDILLIKYNNSGSVEWSRIWGGYYDDYGNAINIDSSGNIYIAGGTNSFGNGSSDIVLIKYENTGMLVWNKTWGGSQWDSAFGLTFDESDNVYVIGSTELYDLYGDVSFLKYSSDGDLLLNETYGGSDSECAYDIECDLDGNLYFTSYTCSFGAETSDFLLMKCNYNGEQVWNISYGNLYPTFGTSLTLDSQANVIAVANTQNLGIDYDINISKISSLGTYVWNYTYSSSDNDLGYNIDLDSKENILITGHSNDDVMTLKLNQTGDKKWVKYWDGNLTDYGYGIGIDTSDNIFITGKTKNSDYKNHLFLLKYLPIPDNFELESDALSPEPDGNFTLQWTESLDADNYSVYQSNYTITSLNSSVIEVIKGNINRTVSINNLGEGVYYFQVIAFNKYGNTSSNCLGVKVQFLPNEFELFNISQLPNTNGNISFSWSESAGAKNYSVYIHDSPIQNLYSEGSLVAEGIKTTFYSIENLTNGDYYYAVVAINEAGVRLSNSIFVNVRRAPISFELTTDANNPDEDGNFELIWTHSKYAQYYQIYFSNKSDLIITQNIFLDNFTSDFYWSTYRYQVNEWNNGIYDFKIVAINDYGISQTNYLEISVAIPIDNIIQDDEDQQSLTEIVQYSLLYLIFFGALAGLIVLYIKRK